MTFLWFYALIIMEKTTNFVHQSSCSPWEKNMKRILQDWYMQNVYIHVQNFLSVSWCLWYMIILKGSYFEQSVGEVSYEEDKGVVRLAIPNASLQHAWHVSCRLFLLFIFLTWSTSRDFWKQEEERGYLGFVVTGEVLVLVWHCWPLQHVAAASCRGCMGLSAAAQHAPLYLVPRKSIWLGPLCSLSSARNKSLAVTNPAPKYVFFIHL